MLSTSNPLYGSMGRNESWKNHALSACQCVIIPLEADLRQLTCRMAPKEWVKTHEIDAWFPFSNASMSTHWAIRRFITTKNNIFNETMPLSCNFLFIYWRTRSVNKFLESCRLLRVSASDKNQTLTDQNKFPCEFLLLFLFMKFSKILACLKS